MASGVHWRCLCFINKWRSLGSVGMLKPNWWEMNFLKHRCLGQEWRRLLEAVEMTVNHSLLSRVCRFELVDWSGKLHRATPSHLSYFQSCLSFLLVKWLSLCYYMLYGSVFCQTVIVKALIDLRIVFPCIVGSITSIKHLETYVCMYICKYVSMYVNMYVYMYVCMYVRM